MSIVFNTPKTALNTSTRGLQNLASGGSMKLTDISVEYTENGDYNVEIPEGFDGFSSVEVKVNVMSPAEVTDLDAIRLDLSGFNGSQSDVNKLIYTKIHTPMALDYMKPSTPIDLSDRTFTLNAVPTISESGSSQCRIKLPNLLIDYNKAGSETKAILSASYIDIDLIEFKTSQVSSGYGQMPIKVAYTWSTIGKIRYEWGAGSKHYENCYGTMFDASYTNVPQYEFINTAPDFSSQGKFADFQTYNSNVGLVTLTPGVPMKGTSITSGSWMYQNQYADAVISMDGFRNLEQSINLKNLKGLTNQSVTNLINEAADLTGKDSCYMQFHSTVFNKITTEQINAATAKNWTLKA